MEDIMYVFNKLKTPNVNAVKDQMKTILSKNIDDIFDAMSPVLQEKLKATNIRSFKSLIDNTESELYIFIQVK
jgi:mevalonate kinase